MAMAAALGAGASVIALRLADVAVWGWRLVYVIPVFGVLLLPGIGRRLPESKRFAAPHAESRLRSHGGRLWLLAGNTIAVAGDSSAHALRRIQLEGVGERHRQDFR